MPATCVIHRCTYNKRKGDKNKPTDVSIHRFPSDPALKKVWVEFVYTQNKKEYNHQPHHRLCSQHFSPESFIDGSLKFRSLPTKFHIRHDLSDDGWCAKPELVFGPNKITEIREVIILNDQHDQNTLYFMEDEILIDSPKMSVHDHNYSVSVKNVDNDFVEDPLKIETSILNARASKIEQQTLDNKVPHIKTRVDDPSMSVCDVDTTVKVKNTDHNDQDRCQIKNSTTNAMSSMKGEAYFLTEVASRLGVEEGTWHIDDFTESDFDTPRKRARNLQRIKNIFQSKEQKLTNAREQASR